MVVAQTNTDSSHSRLTAMGLQPTVKPHREQVFVGCDGVPVTFQDMMDATVATGKYEGGCVFTGQEGDDKGKRVSNLKTKAALGWEPKYKSFVSFMEAGAEDSYTTSGLF